MYASERPAPTSASSTSAPEPLLLREPPANVPPQRHRERDPVEKRPRDLFDHVDLARDVARAPRRDGDVPVRRRPRSRSRSSVARCSSGGTSRPIRRDRALGPEAERPGAPGARRGRRRAPSCARRSDRRAGGSRAPRRARRGTGRPPSPSGSSRPCAARAARSVRRIPSGSKFAASSSTSVVSSVTSLSAPPMIAASATAFSPSVIRRSSVSSRRSVPSSVRSSSPGARAPDDDAPARELRAVERMQRAAPDVHDVVRHVDDVRDRAHVGEEEARRAATAATGRSSTSRKTRPM